MSDFKDQIEDMCRAPERTAVDDETARVIMYAQERHNHVRDQLNSVLSHDDKGIQIGLDDEDAIKFEPGTDLHKGFLAGIHTALYLIGEFPIALTDKRTDNDEEESED